MMSMSTVQILPPLRFAPLEKPKTSPQAPPVLVPSKAAPPQAALPPRPPPPVRPEPPALPASKPPAQLRTPWIDSLPMTEYERKEQRLHDEIMAFVAFMTPSAQETRARELVLNTVKAVIQARFEKCTVSSFGSVAYGLSLPGGDLDLVIETPEVYERRFLVRSLFQLATMLRKAGVTTACDVISQARVPIIKLEVTPALGSLDFDISVNATDGLKAVPVIKGYLDELPALRPLVLVVKTFLSGKGLQSAASGGLSSYAIICIVIGFLKLNPEHYDETLLNSPVESESLGTLLLGFFDFYADKFPYESSYISPTQGKILPKEEKNWENVQRPCALAVECLVDPANNVGKSAQKISQIRAAFREAAQTIRAYKLSLDHGNVLGSILGVSERTLAFCDRIRTLVDSGALEASLKSVVLPSAGGALPRSPPRQSRLQNNDRPPNPPQNRRHHPYAPYQHPYPLSYPHPYQHEPQRPRYPTHGGDIPYINRGPGYYPGPRGPSTGAGAGYYNARPQGTTARHDRSSSSSAYHSPNRRRV